VLVGLAPATVIAVLNNGTTIIVRTAASPFPSLLPVVVLSKTFGGSNSTFTFNTPPVLAMVSPSISRTTPPASLSISLTGANMCNPMACATDIIAVSLAGVPATVVSATPALITVRINGAAAAPISNGAVLLATTSRGNTTLPGAFTFIGPATISSVVPAFGTQGGGYRVTINVRDDSVVTAQCC
jgi:hypothetical protein